MFEENKTVNEEFSVGSIINERYLIEKILGVGGQGIVVKALDTKNYDNPVVIKTLKRDVVDRWSIDKFKEEQRALATLQDVTGVINLIDNGESKSGYKYTVLEFIKGEPLSNLIDDLQHNMLRVSKLFEQIATAVEAAHRKEIFHRDLKPDNILVANPNTKDELIKIIDFGIAKQQSSESSNIEMTVHIVGTPIYLSPNALDKKPNPRLDDIYALGMIAYTMITGEFPIPKDSVNLGTLRLMQTEINNYPPSNKKNNLPSVVDEVILKALAEDPEERYHSPEEFSNQLKWALSYKEPDNEETKQVRKDLKETQRFEGDSKLESKQSAQSEVGEKKSFPILYVVIPVVLVLGASLLGFLIYLSTKQTPQIVSNVNTQPANTPTVVNPTPINQNSDSNIAENISQTNQTPIVTPTPTESNTNTQNQISTNSIQPDDFVIVLDKQINSTATGSDVFKKDDGVRLEINSQKEGILQIFFRENSGKTSQVLNTKISANKKITFPDKKWIFFDENPGEETVYIVVSDPKSPEKIDINSLDSQSNGQDKFITKNGSAVKVVKLKHE